MRIFGEELHLDARLYVLGSWSERQRVLHLPQKGFDWRYQGREANAWGIRGLGSQRLDSLFDLGGPAFPPLFRLAF